MPRDPRKELNELDWSRSPDASRPPSAAGWHEVPITSRDLFELAAATAENRRGLEEIRVRVKAIEDQDVAELRAKIASSSAWRQALTVGVVIALVGGFLTGLGFLLRAVLLKQ